MRRLLIGVVLSGLAVASCSEATDLSPIGPVTSVTSLPSTVTTPTTGSIDEPSTPATVGGGDTTSTPAVAPLQGLAYQEVASVEFPIALIPDPMGNRELLATKAGLISDPANGERAHRSHWTRSQ